MMATFDDVLKERDLFVERIRDASRRASIASEKTATNDPRELLSRYVARLQDATRAKDEAIERYDEEIRHYATLISAIEQTLASARTVAEERAAADETATRDEEKASGELAHAPVADRQLEIATPRPRKGTARGGKRRDG